MMVLSFIALILGLTLASLGNVVLGFALAGMGVIGLIGRRR